MQTGGVQRLGRGGDRLRGDGALAWDGSSQDGAKSGWVWVLWTGQGLR